MSTARPPEPAAPLPMIAVRSPHAARPARWALQLGPATQVARDSLPREAPQASACLPMPLSAAREPAPRRSGVPMALGPARARQRPEVLPVQAQALRVTSRCRVQV